jgi:hypothetical protein
MEAWTPARMAYRDALNEMERVRAQNEALELALEESRHDCKTFYDAACHGEDEVKRLEAELAALRPLKPIAEAAIHDRRMALLGTMRYKDLSPKDREDYEAWMERPDIVEEALSAYLAAQEGGTK